MVIKWHDDLHSDFLRIVFVGRPYENSIITGIVVYLDKKHCEQKE